VCAAVAASGAASGDGRPLRIADLFALEGIGYGYGGPFAVAPDGDAVAFTRLRAKRTLANHQLEHLLGNERGDVWLQERPGQPAINLTDGLATASGWWAPQWSPDGNRLAMLSVRDGRVTLWAWERATRRLGQVSPLEVELRDYERPPFLWLAPTRLLCPFFASSGRRSVMESDLLATPRLASAAWLQAVRGEVSTSSALQSGAAPSGGDEGFDELALHLVDVAARESKALLEGPVSGLSLGPGARAFAFAKQMGAYVPKADQPLPLARITPTADLGQFAIEVRTTDGAVSVDASGESPDARLDSMRWSPDGRELAFLGYQGSRLSAPLLFRIEIGSGRISRTELGALDPGSVDRVRTGLEWTDAGELIIRAARRQGPGRASVDARRDWWLLSRSGRQICLTARMQRAPSELWAVAGRREFLGVASETLWRLRVADGAVMDAGAAIRGSVEGIDWPLTPDWDDVAEFQSPGGEYSRIVVSTRRGGVRSSHIFDARSGRLEALSLPDAQARVVAMTPSRGGGVVAAARGAAGTSLWRIGASTGRSDVLMQTNTFLRGVGGGEIVSIPYRSLAGQELRAWLILPYARQAGARYPLLTWVHGGFIAGSEPPYWHSIAYGDALNMHIPAAHGYAVLLPSMPVRTPGDPDDVLLGLTNGVMPAIDAAIALGHADAGRLFVAGHSFGGYATHGLLTQTQRFKAAISLAGATNLVSQYGTFDARLRYGPRPHANLTNLARMEVGQSNLGGAPWQAVERYARNSPIRYVADIRTPLMIVQGDLDFVAMQQGEELFTALYRLGRRAQLVRYWGEGHEVRSPANVRDFWARALAWLDEHGDVSRDSQGRVLFDGEVARSRMGAPPWPPQRYAEIEERT
jgi:dipeptidyl aminopeptidase/acylaminoacyl peptidase